MQFCSARSTGAFHFESRPDVVGMKLQRGGEYAIEKNGSFTAKRHAFIKRR